tara:strand:+ start:13224 stop:16142 length:2919 start_codon:yes stop_codon:yes gene_type:complete
MTDCNNTLLTKEVIENKERLSRMVKAYNDSNLRVEMYGKINDINDGTRSVLEMEQILKMQDEALVLDDAYLLTPRQERRFYSDLKKHDRQMQSPLGRLEALYKIPAAISRKTPATKRFYQNLDRMKNFERNALLIQGNAMKNIYSNIRKAYIEEGIANRFFAPKVIKKLKEYEDKLRFSDDPEFIFETQEKIKKIVESNEGAFIRDFNTLIALSPKDLKKAIKEGVQGLKYGKDIEEKQGRIGTAYNSHVIDAVNNARIYLNEMGKVNIQALKTLREAIWLKTVNEEYSDSRKIVNLTNRKLKSIDKNIEAAVQRIELGMKEGGYYPQVLLNDAIRLKGQVNKLLEQESYKGIDDQVSVIAEDLTAMLKTNLPANVKAQNTLLERRFSENPFFILEQYGSQAIQFNKLNTIAREYQRVLKVMQNPKLTASYLKGLSNFIDSEFTIATKGLQNRPEWLNKLTRNVRLFETLKAMGLGITGAIRNVASAQFFMAHMGLSAIRTVKAALKTGNIINEKKVGNVKVKSAISYSQLAETVGKIQGFTFGDIGQELYAEGILSKEGAEKLDFKYNDETGQVEVRENRSAGFYPVIDFIKAQINKVPVPGGDGQGVTSLLSKTPEILLSFHRWGENYTRKKMFNYAFVESLLNYQKNPEYWLKHNGDKINLESPMTNKIVKDAANVALFVVNRFAGEYALHAKSRILTGHPGKVDINNKLLNKLEVGATSLTSLGTGLLHYPMFFMDMQYKVLEGTVYGLMSKSFKGSPEARYLGNYAAITAFIGLASVGLNANLFNIFENDLIKKIQNLFRNIQGPDPDELNPNGTIKDNAKGYYGIASDFTGPIVDDLAFLMMASRFIEMPDNDIMRMAFGYDKYLESQGGEAKDRAFWNRLGTFSGFMANKALPSIHNGRAFSDMPRHVFAAYPTPEIKKIRKWTGLFKQSKIKGSNYFLNKKNVRKKDKNSNSIKLDQLLRDLNR